jgi:hypothetical protein
MVNQASPEQNINIMNSGSMDLSIGQVAIAGDDAGLFTITADGCSGAILPQSENCIVKVAFAPNTLGDKNAQLEVASNDADTPVLEVPLCGSGVLFTCPLELAVGNDSGLLPALRLLRNRVLARDSRGRGYIQDYYTWAAPLAEILLRQPDLARRSLALLSVIMPEIERLNNGRQIVIPAALYGEGLALLDIFIQSSGGAMQARLLSLKADLQDAAWLHQLGIDVH